MDFKSPEERQTNLKPPPDLLSATYVCVVVPLTDGYFHQLEKQSTNQSFVGEIKNGGIIFLDKWPQRSLDEMDTAVSTHRLFLNQTMSSPFCEKKHDLLIATASTASLQTRGFSKCEGVLQDVARRQRCEARIMCEAGYCSLSRCFCRLIGGCSCSSCRGAPLTETINAFKAISAR